MKNLAKRCVTTLILLSSAWVAGAQGTAFTYQGRFVDAGSPANGRYDLRFNLFDAVTGGALVAGPITNSAVVVSNGLFTVTVDFGAGVFTGPARFLEVAARSNGVAVAFTVLSPRQQLTPTPYAITAENLDGSLPASQLTGTLPSGALCGIYGCTVSFTNVASSFAGDGSGLLNVNAGTLGGLGPTNFWKTIGNTGTSPTNGNFLGTIDTQPLELRVNNLRALRIEPDPNFSIPNLIGGHAANFVQGGIGNVIAGGGWLADGTNFITGGNLNTISGGYGNKITNAFDSVIGGGYYNIVGANSATVPGGFSNLAIGAYSFAAGQNAQALHQGAFVWADDSTNAPFASTGANQFLVRAGFLGLNRNTSVNASEYFGIFAPVVSNWVGMFIQGQTGSRPYYGYASPIGSAWTEVDGTDGNKWKLWNYGYHMTVTTSGQVGIGTTSPSETLEINGTSRIDDNDLYLRTGTDRFHGLGYRLNVNGGAISVDGPFLYGFSGGCLGVGGPDTAALTWTWLGNIWISNNCNLASLTCRGGATFGGNVGIGNANPTNLLVVGSSGTPAYCNGTTWVNGSDRDSKQDFAALDPAEVLAKVDSLPVQSWSYKAQPGDRHIGPVAQDFHAAFGLNGGDDKHIATVDEGGVALAAIQGLNRKLIQKDAEIADLKARLEKLEQLVNARSAGSQ